MGFRAQGMVPRPWTDWPLGRIFIVVTTLVLLFLATVLALGARQYLLYRQCSQAVAAGDRLLFRFTAIKDHLDQSLVLGQEVNLRAFNVELQELEAEGEQLARNILVPEGLKASLPTRVDLVGLEVRLRAIQEQRREKVRETADLVQTLGNINLGLQQFRFHLGDHTQTILLGLHKIIAGALGLIVVLSCTLLYLLNRRLATPILALCRLTAPAGEAVDPASGCTLHLLTERMQTLLTDGKILARGTGGVDPGDPESCRQAASGYRHAVTGWLGGELASELTNRLNGVINYTQALIDLDGQGGNQSLRAEVYRHLVEEERKTAELVAALQQIGRWQAGGASGAPLCTLSGLLAQLLERPLRAESITLILPADNRCEPLIAAGDLLLVLITLIQQGRMALNRAGSDHQGDKVLRLTSAVPAAADRIEIALSNSAGRWEEHGLGPVWPSQEFCAVLLQVHGGSLYVDAGPRETILRIALPCRGSVA